MSKSETEELIEIEIDGHVKPECLEEGYFLFFSLPLSYFFNCELDFRGLCNSCPGTHQWLLCSPLSALSCMTSFFSVCARGFCWICRIEEQTITAAELITQDIDINEPVGNLKKLLEPRLQIALDGYDICLQDIQVSV